MSRSIYINIVNESEKYQELYDYLNNNKKNLQLSMFSFLLSEKKLFFSAKILTGASPRNFFCGGLCKILDLFVKSWTSFVDFFGSQIRFNV